MAIIRRALSGSTNGQGIALTTAVPATIHTSTTNGSDEVHVWFVNQGAGSTSARIFMGTTGEANKIDDILPAAQGLRLMLPGLFLASGLICYGQATSTGVVAFGFVNRLTTGA